MTTIKELCEAQWNKPGEVNRLAVNIWHLSNRGLAAQSGEERIPTVGKSAEAFMRRIRKHWGPAPMAYCGDAKLKMPDWLRENYKRNCPNNYKELVRLYGKLDKIDVELAKKSLAEIAASN